MADIEVDAMVRLAEPVRPAFRGVDLAYEIDVIAVHRGTLDLGHARLSFEDLRAHRRDERVVCPRKHGTGIEAALQPGRRYRMYLETRSDSLPRLLRAEPME